MSEPFILSLKHKEKIEEVCKPLSNLGLTNFVMYIVFNNGQTFVLSNVFNLLQSYYQDELYKEDYTYTKGFIDPVHSGHYFCEEEGALSPRIKDLCSQKYNYYPTYNLVRKHSECTFVFSAIKSHRDGNVNHFYKHTVSSFEHFCIHFVDSFLALILEHNPEYRYSFVLTNKALRDSVIKNQYKKEIKITSREKDCLSLLAQGKKTKDIARLLDLSRYTVEDYFRNIRHAFSTQTTHAALAEAIQLGIIGNLPKLSDYEIKIQPPKLLRGIFQ